MSREMHRFLDEMSRDAALVGRNPVPFAGLPSDPTIGTRRIITDSNTTTWGATVAAGGSDTVLAWFNGTNWTVIGI